MAMYVLLSRSQVPGRVANAGRMTSPVLPIDSTSGRPFVLQSVTSNLLDVAAIPTGLLSVLAGMNADNNGGVTAAVVAPGPFESKPVNSVATNSGLQRRASCHGNFMPDPLINRTDLFAQLAPALDCVLEAGVGSCKSIYTTPGTDSDSFASAHSVRRKI